eukprot:CAMPEP_0174245390 /NCGR_PEP_ID=MMETSP0417-20130205/38704_1 /TAXON_ID=242541 /ORGANISM="Mayorella sp, Strain BSH-02190019" /LENGTH=247 /DNA_ID=CAMNT_0015325165 /DNA_START=77 /DNA_END=820 /DNA_ORIENTATION=-
MATSASSKGLAIVTGASSGIGLATARQLHADGYAVSLFARREDRLKEVVADLGPNASYACVDVTDAASVQAAVEKAEKEHGPTSVLVCNAGCMLLGQIPTQDPAEWKRMLDVNVMGVLLCMNSVLGGMYERRSGLVVNVSSIAGRKSFPNHAVYCATKFAVHAMTETIREEASKHGVRCTVVAPGVVETELLSHTTDAEIVSGYKEWKKDMKVLEAVDIARAVSYAAAQPEHVCIREIVIGPTAQAP